MAFFQGTMMNAVDLERVKVHIFNKTTLKYDTYTFYNNKKDKISNNPAQIKKMKNETHFQNSLKNFKTKKHIFLLKIIIKYLYISTYNQKFP